MAKRSNGEAALEAVLYARFSPRPNAAECESCEAQLERMRAYCQARDMPVLAEYRDDNVSGANLQNRPGLAAAMVEACQRRCVLVVYSLSRLARNTRAAIELSDKLARAGANLASLSESFDTSTSGGRLFFTLMSAFAQWEREVIAERTSDMMKRHQAAGRKMSLHCPIGWEDDPSQGQHPGGRCRFMKPCPAEQAFIEEILAMRIAGASYGHIARSMNERYPDGIRGYPWSHSSVRSVCRRAGETNWESE